MAKRGFKLNIPGWNAMRKSGAIHEILQEHASRAVEAANGYIGQDGFSYEVVDMPTRAVAFVRAESPKAREVSADKNILLKVVN